MPKPIPSHLSLAQAKVALLSPKYYYYCYCYCYYTTTALLLLHYYCYCYCNTTATATYCTTATALLLLHYYYCTTTTSTALNSTLLSSQPFTVNTISHVSTDFSNVSTEYKLIGDLPKPKANITSLTKFYLTQVSSRKLNLSHDVEYCIVYINLTLLT